MGKKQKQAGPSRVVCRNRKARHEFDVLETLECGIALTGTEVKSIRNGQISINEAYAKVKNGEVWLYDSDIAPYPPATIMNHEPTRPRKLLLHKREIRKFAETAAGQGMTLVPLAVYFSRGRVKVELAVARGRKLHDKRQKLRQKADQREINRAMQRRK